MAGGKDLSKVLEDDDTNEVLEEIGNIEVASREDLVSVQDILRYFTLQYIMFIVSINLSPPCINIIFV